MVGNRSGEALGPRELRLATEHCRAGDRRFLAPAAGQIEQVTAIELRTSQSAWQSPDPGKSAGKVRMCHDVAECVILR